MKVFLLVAFLAIADVAWGQNACLGYLDQNYHQSITYYNQMAPFLNKDGVETQLIHYIQNPSISFIVPTGAVYNSSETWDENTARYSIVERVAVNLYTSWAPDLERDLYWGPIEQSSSSVAGSTYNLPEGVVLSQAFSTDQCNVWTYDRAPLPRPMRLDDSQNSQFNTLQLVLPSVYDQSAAMSKVTYFLPTDEVIMALASSERDVTEEMFLNHIIPYEAVQFPMKENQGFANIPCALTLLQEFGPVTVTGLSGYSYPVFVMIDEKLTVYEFEVTDPDTLLPEGCVHRIGGFIFGPVPSPEPTPSPEPEEESGSGRFFPGIYAAILTMIFLR